LPFFQRPHLALTAAGLGLLCASPGLATERPDAWDLNELPMPAPRVSVLPPVVPIAPRLFAITPERKALLNTIRFAEGTWANGHEVGYRVMFGGGLMPSLDRHPDQVRYTSGYASAAAGAYQFMPFTWSMVTRNLGVSGFHPQVQDQGALFLIQRRGALNLADRGEMTPELAARLAPEWASFPTLAGSSYYGQPVKRFAELKRFYESNLAELRGQNVTNWENVAIRQVPKSCNQDSLSCQLEQITAPSSRGSR
jgi:lysozyme